MYISKKYKILAVCGCLFGLITGILISERIQQKQLSLHERWKQGLLHPDMISVWMPLPEEMTAQDAQQTFERLTQNFETQYPGFGVDLQIYANPDDYQAMLTQEHPVVWISQEAQGEDLSELISELNASYLTDLSKFKIAVPLSFHLKAMYADSPQKWIAAQDIPTEISENFPAVMPSLHSTSGAAIIDQNTALSGTVRMIPVSENDVFPMQFSNYCCINPEADQNSRKIGMLWISYLLSEEAQSILFAEHYGELPLHEQAFSHAITIHKSFAVLDEIKTKFVSEMEESSDA